MNSSVLVLRSAKDVVDSTDFRLTLEASGDFSLDNSHPLYFINVTDSDLNKFEELGAIFSSFGLTLMYNNTRWEVGVVS